MKVLVTGANGHLGTQLVAELIGRDHTVRGSVRSLADPSRTDHLRALGPVELVEADLDKPASLRAAMDGQDAVIHAAAIYELYAPGRDEEIVRASVEGTRSAMLAASDARIKRFILTSSVVTLPLTAPGASAVDEKAWTTDTRVPYVRAKTLAEGEAWDLSDRLRLELATVLPGAFGGPGFQRNTPTIGFLETIMLGALRFGAPPINYPYVDVRDVARAHRLVLERGARGRYIAINDRQPSVKEIGQTMHSIDKSIAQPPLTVPGFLMPALPLLEGLASRIDGTQRSMTKELASMLRGRIWNISNAKIRDELGWVPEISIKESLADTIAALRARQARQGG